MSDPPTSCRNLCASMPSNACTPNSCAMKRFVSTSIGVALIAVAVAPAARASLGGTEATVETDRLAIGATRRTLASGRFTVHELQSPSGTTVREFVSPAGTVFAVAWQGSTLPDLRQLLGAHFDEYVAASATRRTRRSPVFIELPGLVVQSSGHLRAFTGRAYLPGALPPGVSSEEVR
jgi:uncharacterized protein DUF2844